MDLPSRWKIGIAVTLLTAAACLAGVRAELLATRQSAQRPLLEVDNRCARAPDSCP